MTPERWQRVERVLQAALAIEPPERPALLERECAGDPALREEVESLIGSAQPAQSFLKGNALEDATVLLEAAAFDSLIGREIDHYRIEKQLGFGGMGEVYLAQDLSLRRKVALKLVDPTLTGDRATRMRFLREARIASALDHPNICTIHEVGEDSGRLYIAMQYVEGDTLKQVIGNRPLPLDSLLSISLQIADALAVAHAQGIIHRDIKPANIIVTSRGQAKVLDFGLAKLLERPEGETETHLTIAGAVMGTPASMSPEQARAESVDHRTDIFSFGVVLYEMATGRIPFSGRSKADVISALLTQPHTPAADFNKEVPASLSALIDRTLAKEPNQRYQSMPEVIAHLSQVVIEVGGLDRLFNFSNNLAAFTGAGPIVRDRDLLRGTVPLVPPRQQKPRLALNQRIQKRAVVVVLALIAVLVIGVLLAINLSRRAQPLPARSIESIAVLPFKPLVAGSRDEVLELGMADTLINKLSSIRKISVRPLSAVRKYAGLEQDAAAAGREQKVDAVLDGNIQKSGDKIRMSVRLVRVADGREMWAEQFDEQFTDIFSLQDSVSSKVSGLLAVALTSEEKELLTKHQTRDVEAYQLYALGRYHLSRLTDDGFKKGRGYFQQATEKDPNYALAHAGLADAYNRLSGWNAVAPKDGFPRAREAALKALQLDEGLPEAHTQLAVVKLLYDWDFAGSEAEYKRAVQINPSNPDTRYLYGLYLWGMGRFEESLAEMKRAQELDPVSLEKIAGTGDVFYFQRRYDQAIAQYQKALEMDPNSGYAHWAIGNVYLAKGMYEQAIAEYQKAIPLSGDSPEEPASLAYAYALSGKQREARQVLDVLLQRARHSYIPPTMIAFIYSGLGEKDKAFAWLEKAYDGRDFILVLLRVDPMFDRLRADPRFAELVRRVGFPQ